MSAQTYAERLPVPALADLVRTVWIQQTGAEPYLQRNLPTGGVELHCPIGSLPRLVGPLTGPSVEVIAPGTTMIGVRFHPGVAASVLGLPASELVDLTLHLHDVWGTAAVVLGEHLHSAPTPAAALSVMQAELIRRRVAGAEPDPLVAEAVRRLMLWQSTRVGPLSAQLAISETQLRRRCLAAVGVGPKALQQTLRFQGLLALVQSGAGRARSEGGDGLAKLATEAGYADQAHLSRECARLSGRSPSALIGDVAGRCACGHDHSASFVPILRPRPRSIAASA